MKFYIAVMLLFASVNAHAKGLILASSHYTISGGDHFYPTPSEISSTNIWTNSDWNIYMYNGEVQWTNNEVHLLMEDDSRIKFVKGSFDVRFENKTLDYRDGIDRAFVKILMKNGIAMERELNLMEIEFVPNKYDQTDLDIIPLGYSSLSRLQLGKKDQELVQYMIATATDGMSADELESTQVQIEFHGAIKLKMELQFNLPAAQRALGLLPEPESQPEVTLKKSLCETLLGYNTDPRREKDILGALLGKMKSSE